MPLPDCLSCRTSHTAQEVAEPREHSASKAKSYHFALETAFLANLQLFRYVKYCLANLFEFPFLLLAKLMRLRLADIERANPSVISVRAVMQGPLLSGLAKSSHELLASLQFDSASSSTSSISCRHRVTSIRCYHQVGEIRHDVEPNSRQILPPPTPGCFQDGRPARPQDGCCHLCSPCSKGTRYHLALLLLRCPTARQRAASSQAHHLEPGSGSGRRWNGQGHHYQTSLLVGLQA
jgi:hypothetical protein